MNRIKELRLSLNFTQSEFAKKIGVSQQTLSGVENDTRPLTDHTIITICSVFGVSEEWLRTGEGDMYPMPSEEDTELIDALGIICGDDVDPVRKKLATAAIKFIIDLPDEALPAFRAYIASAKMAFEEEKTTED